MQSATDITASNALPARLPKGFVLEGYVVDGWLRDGGMAAIYRAHRACDEQRVALKLQLPSTAHDEMIGGRFDLEAELMRRVGGTTHVVELFDAGVLDDGRRYLVMEWVDGEDLEEVLDFSRNQDQRLQISRACRIGCDVARGLAELHEHGVVHLDLKPANVMIGAGDDGRDAIKLVDFGIAVDLRTSAVEAEASAAPMGTSSYMSPEQARGEPSVPAFDVYALGVLLFEILSGTRLPPDGWSSETLPPLEELRRGVPRSLAALVRACMHVDPECRPASAEEVASQLHRISTELDTSPRTAAAGAEVVAVRSGGTEIVPVPVAEIAAAVAAAPVRTGATEVRLTHEEVLQSSGMSPALQPEAPTSTIPRLETQAPQYESPERSWVRGLMIVGAAALLGGALTWIVAGDRDSTVPGAVPESVLADEEQATPTRQPEPNVRVEDGKHSRAQTVVPVNAPTLAVEPALERTPEPELEPDPPPKPQKSGKAAGPTKEACEAMRTQAVDAKKLRAWSTILQVTAQRSCWSSSALRLERTRLRVAALVELEEYRKCVKEGGKSRDQAVAAATAFCKKKLEGGG